MCKVCKHPRVEEINDKLVRRAKKASVCSSCGREFATPSGRAGHTVHCEHREAGVDSDESFAAYSERFGGASSGTFETHYRRCLELGGSYTAPMPPPKNPGRSPKGPGPGTGRVIQDFHTGLRLVQRDLAAFQTQQEGTTSS